MSSHAGPGVSALCRDESGPPVLCAFSARVPDPLGGQLWGLRLGRRAGGLGLLGEGPCDLDGCGGWGRVLVHGGPGEPACHVCGDPRLPYTPTLLHKKEHETHLPLEAVAGSRGLSGHRPLSPLQAGLAAGCLRPGGAHLALPVSRVRR